MMILSTDIVGISEAIGNMGPTALLALIIVALVFDRKSTRDELKKLREENRELQDKAVIRAETGTMKMMEVAGEAKTAFNTMSTSIVTMNESMKDVLYFVRKQHP